MIDPRGASTPPVRLRLVQPAGWVRPFFGVSLVVVTALLYRVLVPDRHGEASVEGQGVAVVGVVIGLALTLYRRVVVLDWSRGTVELRRWCGITWTRTVRGLPAYDRVELRRRFEGRRSESWPGFTYPVVLAGAGGELELVFDGSELRSRHRARAVARIADRDLVDLTEEPPVRLSAEEVRLGPRERWLRSGLGRSDLPVPDPGRVAAERPGDRLRLRIARERAPVEGALILIGALAGGGFLLYAAQELARSPRAGAGERVAMLVLASLGMAAIGAGVRARARRVAAHESVEVTPDHLGVRLDAPFGGGVQIPLGEIEALEPRQSAIVVTSERAILRLGEALDPGERAWVVEQLRMEILRVSPAPTGARA